MQKPASDCYIIERFIGMIVQRSDYYALLDTVIRLRADRNVMRLDGTRGKKQVCRP